MSRADFLSDVANTEKRGGYGQIAEAVYYAAPDGIIKAEDVPDECGLVIEREIGVFDVLKRPKRKAIVVDSRIFMNLVLKPQAQVASSRVS